jgi:hypothetical protein
VTVKPHVRGRREIDGLELRRRRLVLVVLFRWFPVGDRVHHLKVVVAQSRTKKFGEKMKQTLEKKKRDESA